ncbi:LysR family transcriptional regulator [Stappia sp.]|uniref:winged helix-turn-helix domain-containing protein n=1 Tax=Stappia sp. TaxID=1870903 RepID=UPI0032D8FD44
MSVPDDTPPAAPAAADDSGLRLRLVLEPDVAFGPGKADLLEGIAETGSIAAAGRRMGMSYKRAWTLVETLNGAFAAPLVARSRGGAQGGGARLTETGATVLALYRDIEAKAARASRADRDRLQALLRSQRPAGEAAEDPDA